MYRVDNLAFLNAHGEPPIIDNNIGLDLAHVTAAPPFFSTTDQLLNGAEAPNGRVIPGINGFRGLLEKQGVVIIESANDIRSTDDPGTQLQVVMGIQGSPLDGDTANIAQLRSAGLRIMGLGYESSDHPYGSGFSDANKPLTALGRSYVEALAENNMILDLSHSGHQTALDTLEYTRDHQPNLSIYASHTGVLEASGGHHRNFPAEILQGIKERGGIVGIYALTFALHDSDNSFDPMLSHIHAAVELLGDDSVTIGTDGIYKTYSEEERRQQYENMSRMLNPQLFQARFPTEPDDLNTPSKMDVITGKLINEGYTTEQVERIVGLNSHAFYKKALSS